MCGFGPLSKTVASHLTDSWSGHRNGTRSSADWMREGVEYGRQFFGLPTVTRVRQR